MEPWWDSLPHWLTFMCGTFDLLNHNICFLYILSLGVVVGCDHMVVRFILPMPQVPITINIVSLNPTQARCTLDATLCDKVCQWLVTGRWFSLDTPPIKPIKSHDTTEILLKVALNTITLILYIFIIHIQMCTQ